MIYPEREQRAQQVRPAQDRRVGRSESPHDDVIAPAGAGMASIEHELLSAETCDARVFIETHRVADQFLPRKCRLKIHLDDPRIRRHFENAQPWIVGWRLAFDDHRQPGRPRRVFDDGDQFKVVRRVRNRRHENMQPSLAGFDTKRGAHDPRRRLLRLRRPVSDWWRRIRQHRSGDVGLADTAGRASLPQRRIRPAFPGEKRGIGTRLANPFPDGRVFFSAPGKRRAGARGRLTGQSRQMHHGRQRVSRDKVGIVFLPGPWERVQRQAQSHGRVPGCEIKRLLPHEPRPAHPSATRALQRHGKAHLSGQTLLKEPPQPLALQFIFQIGLQRVHIGRQPALPPKVIIDVLVGGHEPALIQFQPGDDFLREPLRLGDSVAIVHPLVSD